jgi:hypothetical protein
MDIRLHAERVDRRRAKLTRPAMLGDLPEGAMVSHLGQPALVAGHALLPWSLGGYGPPIDVGQDASLTLLTPPSIVAALLAGYRPFIHPTAGPTTMRSFPGSDPGRQRVQVSEQ